jgi:hypothetical protein
MESWTKKRVADANKLNSHQSFIGIRVGEMAVIRGVSPVSRRQAERGMRGNAQKCLRNTDGIAMK